MTPKFLVSLIIVDFVFAQVLSISRSSLSPDGWNLLYASFITSNYIFVLFLLYLERSRLADFGLDRYALLLFTLSCFLRVRFLVPGEVWFYLILWITGLLTAFFIYKKWSTLPKTSFYWVGMALNISLWVCIIAILAQYLSGFVTLFENYVEPRPFIAVLFNRTLAAISNSATFVQLLLRGFLWGYLLKMEIEESHVFWIVTVGACLLNWSDLRFPAFFASIYLLSHATSYLRRSSTQLFPSMVLHTVVYTVSESVMIMLRWAK